MTGYKFETHPVQYLRVLTAEELLNRLNELRDLQTKLHIEILMVDGFYHQRLQETLQKLEAQR